MKTEVKSQRSGVCQGRGPEGSEQKCIRWVEGEPLQAQRGRGGPPTWEVVEDTEGEGEAGGDRGQQGRLRVT